MKKIITASSNKKLLKLVKKSIKSAKPDPIWNNTWYLKEDVNHSTRTSGLCNIPNAMFAIGLITYAERFALEALFHKNRPEGAGDACYWFSVARKEWKKQRIEFIDKLIALEDEKVSQKIR